MSGGKRIDLRRSIVRWDGVEESFGLLMNAKNVGQPARLGKTHTTIMPTFTRVSLGVNPKIDMNTNRVMVMIMTRLDMPKSVVAACYTEQFECSGIRYEMFQSVNGA